MQTNCSHEIKGHLLFRRLVMSNLDSVLKSKDITLPTLSIKPMVFPVIMCGCESWSVKAEPEELTLPNCGAGEDS